MHSKHTGAPLSVLMLSEVAELIEDVRLFDPVGFTIRFLNYEPRYTMKTFDALIEELQASRVALEKEMADAKENAEQAESLSQGAKEVFIQTRARLQSVVDCQKHFGAYKAKVEALIDKHDEVEAKRLGVELPKRDPDQERYLNEPDTPQIKE